MAIGEAVCRLGIKLVVGVGHHRDRCVLDFVAHSEKTPTAAAGWIVKRADEFSERLDRAAHRVAELAERKTERSWRRLERTAASWQRQVADRVHGERRRLGQVVSSLSTAADRAVQRRRHRLSYAGRQLERESQRVASDAAMRVDLAARELDPVRLQRHVGRVSTRVDDVQRSVQRAVEERLGREGLRLEHLQAKLRLSDPRRILERGFAIVRDADDRVVTEAAALRALETARVQMRDGAVAVTPSMENSDDD
jgi:exodeoxyribonuclease VII large subunit